MVETIPHERQTRHYDAFGTILTPKPSGPDAFDVPRRPLALSPRVAQKPPKKQKHVHGNESTSRASTSSDNSLAEFVESGALPPSALESSNSRDPFILVPPRNIAQGQNDSQNLLYNVEPPNLGVEQLVSNIASTGETWRPQIRPVSFPVVVVPNPLGSTSATNMTVRPSMAQHSFIPVREEKEEDSQSSSDDQSAPNSTAAASRPSFRLQPRRATGCDFKAWDASAEFS